MNFAGVRRLPVVFVIDNNQFAYSTPTNLEFSIRSLADRADAYGFEGVVVDGTDVLAVYREAHRAIEKARAGGGPTLLECRTLRMEGHAVHDDAFYVPRELHETWLQSDPIERFRGWLGEHDDEFTPGARRGDQGRGQARAERRHQSAPRRARCRTRRARTTACGRSRRSSTPRTTSSARRGRARGLLTIHPQATGSEDEAAWPSKRTCRRSRTACARRCAATSGSS